MKKNVVVITGSPRQGGNTDLMAEAFAKGAKAAGHDVVVFNAATDPIRPCQACKACWSKGTACVFDDGFTRLAPLMEKADAIALCSPVYWFSFSGQLKMVIDKLYSFAHAPSERELRATVYLLMAAGDSSPDIFAAAKQEFDNSFAHLGLPVGGQVLAAGVYAKGDVKNTGFLAQAEKLGREIA